MSPRALGRFIFFGAAALPAVCSLAIGAWVLLLSGRLVPLLCGVASVGLLVVAWHQHVEWLRETARAHGETGAAGRPIGLGG